MKGGIIKVFQKTFLKLILITSLTLIIFIGSGLYYIGHFLTIKIGFVASLTGELSELGVTGRNGAIIAVEEINQKRSWYERKIELVIVDDKKDVDEALEVDKKLYEQGTEIIIGHMLSVMTQKSLPFANENKILMVSPTISTDTLTGIDDYFIRVIPANFNEGKKLALAAINQIKTKNVLVVYDQRNILYAEPIIKIFEEKFTASGGNIVNKISFVNQRDLVTKAQKIDKTSVDGVLLIASALDASMFCQQMKKNNFQIPTFLPMWAMTNDFIQAGGRSVEGAYLVSKVDLNSKEEKYQHFYEKYYDKYKEKPTFASVLSYNALLVVMEGIKIANSVNGEKVKIAILNKSVFPGLQGEQIIDKYGDMQSEYYIYIVKDGGFVKVEGL